MPLPLEDIVLPAPPGSWPWAPAIWAGLILAALLLFWAGRTLAHKWPFWRARRTLARQLAKQPITPARLNQRLHAFACRWLGAPAAISGEEWVTWMVQQAPGLPESMARTLTKLANAPYTDAPGDSGLTNAAIQWLRRVRP